LENDSDEDKESVEVESPISQITKGIEEEFNLRWGFLEIAKNVADYTNETFFQTMDRSVVEVLTIATLLKEKVALIESKHK
jgi:hypothetical protein